MTRRELIALEDLLTAKDVAAELGISLRRVNDLINKGQLPATMLGKAWVIRRADIDLVRTRRPRGRPPSTGKNKNAAPRKKKG
jgi:excisionase family DNA binding protein